MMEGRSLAHEELKEEVQEQEEHQEVQEEEDHNDNDNKEEEEEHRAGTTISSSSSTIRDEPTNLSSTSSVFHRITSRRGSALHRNTQRSHRLVSLFLKKKIRNQVKQGVERGDETEGEELILFKATEKDLYDEVQQEENLLQYSAKLEEINKLVEPYTVHLGDGERITAQKFALEVRLKNVSYTVPDESRSARTGASSRSRSSTRRTTTTTATTTAVASTTASSTTATATGVVVAGPPKIQTVYNASCVYSAYKWLRRVSQCEAKPSTDLPPKFVLEDINLVIQPGKQYLVLGPPGSGKSTLLKTIAGLIRHEEDDHDPTTTTTTTTTASHHPPHEADEEDPKGAQEETKKEPNERPCLRRQVSSSYEPNEKPSLMGQVLYNGRSLKVNPYIHIRCCCCVLCGRIPTCLTRSSFRFHLIHLYYFTILYIMYYILYTALY
jgi:ABC-type glutathione transport system ATPase component